MKMLALEINQNQINHKQNLIILIVIGEWWGNDLIKTHDYTRH